MFLQFLCLIWTEKQWQRKGSDFELKQQRPWPCFPRLKPFVKCQNGLVLSDLIPSDILCGFHEGPFPRMHLDCAYPVYYGFHQRKSFIRSFCNLCAETGAYRTSGKIVKDQYDQEEETRQNLNSQEEPCHSSNDQQWKESSKKGFKNIDCFIKAHNVAWNQVNDVTTCDLCQFGLVQL